MSGHLHNIHKNSSHFKFQTKKQPEIKEKSPKKSEVKKTKQTTKNNPKSKSKVLRFS